MNYQLPPYVLKDMIRLDGDLPTQYIQIPEETLTSKNVRNLLSPYVQIPLSERVSPDKTQALADILCKIAHENTGYPYQPTPRLGDFQVDHGFRVSVAGRINPFIHLPSYQVNALKAHPDSIERAEGLVVIVSDAPCPHCVRSLDFIPPILKGTIAHVNVL